ncbi:hypothetical protein [Ramlibacter sp.]|uniref:hypothetical protein n=1 Tax=Ramlibacter sp. TaxID=1917967 RepID=UPI00184C2F25|nr:hypothetical protein [Ramlibacter sp.]MBA2674963.1 hypothetical protein [Ramlibacter sp.]
MAVLDNESLILLVGLAVAALFIGAWLFNRKRQSEGLEKRFGPEYNRAVEEMGSKPKAEAELLARQKRVEQLDIVPLPAQEAARFIQSWTSIQSRFIDNPKGVLAEADMLVRELMLRRGYPMGDFERRAADISVRHPAVVDHYRAAHAIAQSDARGEADTEQMRQAVVHYRALFAELLEVEQPQGAARHEPHVETH